MIENTEEFVNEGLLTDIFTLKDRKHNKSEIITYLNDFSIWKELSKEVQDKFLEKADFQYKENKFKAKEDKKIEIKEQLSKRKSKYINFEKKELTEEIVKDGKTMFITYAQDVDEVFSPANEIYINKERIEPVIGEEIEKGAILFPSDAIEYKNDIELDKNIKEFIMKYLDIDNDTLMFLTWNIKRSWIYERFNTLSYSRALGDTGLGKSRYLKTIGSLHYKPLFCNGATTPAPLFRIVDKYGGISIVADEFDLNNSDESNDIIKFINIGFEKDSFIMRCDQNDASIINFFPAYCPKVLATRKSFDDKATESRCITTIMRGTNRKDIPSTLNDEFFKEAEILRNKLLMWRFRNFFIIDPDKKFNINMDEFEPRIRQIISSFACLIPDGQLDEFKKFIKEKQDDLIEERKNSFAGTIVEGVYKLYSDGIKDISSEDIIERQNILDKNNNYFKPRGLTKTLRELGFAKTEIKRVNGTVKRCLPMDNEHLNTLFIRYGFKSCNDVTVVTVVTDTDKKLTKELNDEKTRQNSDLNLEGCSPLLSLQPLHRYNNEEENNEE